MVYKDKVTTNTKRSLWTQERPKTLKGVQETDGTFRREVRREQLEER